MKKLCSRKQKATKKAKDANQAVKSDLEMALERQEERERSLRFTIEGLEHRVNDLQNMLDAQRKGHEGELWKRAFEGARAECKDVRETLGKANARYINLQAALKQDLKAMARRARQRKETFMEIPLASLMFLVSDPLDVGQSRAEENIGGGGKDA